MLNLKFGFQKTFKIVGLLQSKKFKCRREISDGAEDVVSDEKLKEFFKEHYGIDVKENGAELTEKERNTLRGLKHHLSSEAHEKAISNGVFKTMVDFKKWDLQTWVT